MKQFTNTWRLTLLALRRDRWIMAIWVGLIAITPASLVSTVKAVYPTVADRINYMNITNSNPAFLANYGPIYAPSVGAVSAQRSGTMPLIIALAALLTVIRHTRTDEEQGRRELVGAGVVGRQASLAAAIVATCAASVLLGVLTSTFLVAQGLPLAGSIALGAGYAATGVLYAGLGGLVAQLSQTAGGARGMGISILAATLLFRAIGDARMGGSGSWLSWFSPVHWAHQLRPYAHEQWWPLLLFAGGFVVLYAAAYALEAKRDLGAGVVPARIGRANAPATLGSSLGLAWRQQRALFWGWVIAMAVMGLFFGAIGNSVGEVARSSAGISTLVEKLGGRGALVDQFFGFIITALGLTVSAYAVQAALRARREEAEGRAEPLLSTAVTRWSFAGSHLAFAIVGPAIALGTAGVTAGLMYGASAGNTAAEVWRLLGATFIQLPAIYVLAGTAMALFGLVPRWASLAWGVLGATIFVGIFGPLLNASQWILDLSPFTHLPRVPGGEITVAPLAWLIAIALALMAAGLVGFRRRDLTEG